MIVRVPKISMFGFYPWDISFIPQVIYSVSTGNIIEQVRRSLIIDNFCRTDITY